ncbi:MULTISPECIES: response regulator [unclassified Agarivorans]|uniref:response regulator n=1 Tax=unclassified Agarivorans TaxID=2636026 RepID=UPI0026E2AD55|nr:MULTISPECIES: response regulator [unclassified Agarivorans]MDO6685898.1 response regulator [Agarivorans sp. 3_MG-2023]MDO6713964.1 response regulator [Agarivorans sp. 2_MG-2023]
MNLSKLTVLVVDDMAPMRKITQEQLRRFGVGNIVQAENGAQALSVLKKRHVDLILSDWNMPVMSGIEFLKEVRNSETWRHIPFIMITAEAERDRVSEAISGGVTDLIIKPFTTSTLQGRVKQAAQGDVRNRAQYFSTEEIEEIISDELEDEDAYQPPPVKSQQHSILVVDDTPENLTLLGGLLRSDYRVLLTKEGQKALDICHSDTPPDLVLLDVMMPGMDGYEVLQKLREHPSSQHIPVIFVTALTEVRDQTKGLSIGAVDYITKPIQPDLLKLRVRNLLRYVDLHKHLQSDLDNLLEKEILKNSVDQLLRHDLKGPIAGIVALAEEIKEDRTLSSSASEHASVIDELSMQLLNMINLSTELYKIEQGRFKLQAKPFSIHLMLKKMLSVVKNTFNTKQLTMYLEPEEEDPGNEALVYGDESLSYSLFFNLLKNACEAAPDRTRVSVRISTSADKIAVTTENIGAVPQSIRENFWEKYVTSGKQSGTGLGTYSVSLLTHAQNGEVNMKVSDAENTTTITVSLLLAETKN